MPNVNPAILRWARETAGLAEEEAVEKLSIRDARGVTGVGRLRALEDGSVTLTRALLVRMAKRYRRPLLTFYLAAPPTLYLATALSCHQAEFYRYSEISSYAGFIQSVPERPNFILRQKSISRDFLRWSIYKDSGAIVNNVSLYAKFKQLL